MRVDGFVQSVYIWNANKTYGSTLKLRGTHHGPEDFEFFVFVLSSGLM